MPCYGDGVHPRAPTSPRLGTPTLLTTHRPKPTTNGPARTAAAAPQLEAVNVTLTGVRGVGASLGSLHGPLHATGLRSAALERFNCSDVRGGNGWACVMLQYDTTVGAGM